MKAENYGVLLKECRGEGKEILEGKFVRKLRIEGLLSLYFIL